MSTDAVTHEGQRIERIEVTGGFLEGAVLELAGGLNCLIGPRGSGKTTALELVRHALDLFPEDEYSPGAKKRFDSLVSDNLQDGRVRITVKTRDGVSYIIDRTATGETMVLTGDGQPTEIKLSGGSFFTTDIYSQNQVESIADNPENQLALIDRFAAEELRRIGQEIRSTLAALEANANEILAAGKDLESLTGDIDRLPGIEERLKTFAGPASEEAEKVNQAHALHSLRDRERRAAEAAMDVFRRNHDDLDRYQGVIERELAGVFAQDILDGPNGPRMKKMVQIAADCNRDVDALVEAIRKRIKDAGWALEEERKGLQADQQKQELSFRELMEKQKEAQGKEAERIRLETDRNALSEKKRKHQERLDQIRGLQEKRDELLRTLSSHRDNRYALRKGVADEITAMLGTKIRVRVDQYGDQEPYTRFLLDALKPRFKGPTIERLAEGLPPRQLREAVIHASDPEPDYSLLIDQGGISRDQAEKLVPVLSRPEALFRLDTIEIGDKPTIELLDGREYKDSTTLSTGQKCTTILPILLLKGDNPLLVDQPEDNLDNRFIYETVVDIVRKVRDRRQLIFVTHNPNIPVLGDAQRVFVLRSDGQRAEVEKAGTVDDCRDEIVTLLEGGDEAFRLRQKKYGIA